MRESKFYRLSLALPLAVPILVAGLGGTGARSMLSLATWKNWLRWTLETQPQYILYAVAGVICINDAVVALSQQVLRFNRTRANKALQLTAR
jgi:ABC-type sulfate transport system permease component